MPDPIVETTHKISFTDCYLIGMEPKYSQRLNHAFGSSLMSFFAAAIACLMAIKAETPINTEGSPVAFEPSTPLGLRLLS